MVYLLPGSSAFEFVVVASLRTKQLMAGCTPRVAPSLKLTTTAAAEIIAGKVARLAPASLGDSPAP